MKYLFVLMIVFTSCNIFDEESKIDEAFQNNYDSRPEIVIPNRVFTESTSGAISNTINIFLENDEFTGSVTDDFLVNGKLTVVNIPAGLTASIVKMSQTTLMFSLTGAAASHTTGDNISNISIMFLDSAFVNTPASAVEFSFIGDISVNFL